MAHARDDLPPRRMTLAAFDRWHKNRPERWELIYGVPVMMAPGSLKHTTIKGNVFRRLANALEGKPCRALVDGAQIKGQDFSAIPDVVVTCKPLPTSGSVVAEPALIVEVLSPSSERDDAGRQWRAYCLIGSLQHYLTVSQEERFVTVHTRTGPFSWNVQVHQDGAIRLAALDTTLSLDDVYDGVVFAPKESGDG
ncbi:MAG: Uma2 family endonuclease [Geminicoccaceae bacterium]|nr:Uma2 family endonuclease [Geminicoccaceae bacterium]